MPRKRHSVPANLFYDNAGLTRICEENGVAGLTRGPLAQGALAWVWAKSKAIVPIPGFKTAAQAEENVGVLCFGPLGPAQMEELERLIPPLEWRQM